MFRIFAALCVLTFTSFAVVADDSTPSSGENASETTYEPLVDIDDNTSVGGYGNTTTTGGYNTGGSGQAIPDGSVGSRSESSGGVMIEHTFP